MRQFYGHLEKCVLSAGKTHVRKIPLFLGGFFGGGGECRFYFYGREDFSDTPKVYPQLCKSKCLNRQNRGLVSTKKLVFKGKEGDNMYTKEPLMCLCVTSSYSIGV